MYRQISREMLDFINASPCPRMVVENLKKSLVAEDYIELFENESWNIKKGGRYFLARSGSTLIAFRIPDEDIRSYRAVLTHTDSPCFKLKPSFELDSSGAKRLSVEKYGGPIPDSFFDIPLAIAGSVTVSSGDGVCEKTVYLENACVIPRTPPHLSKEQGTNPAVDMCPVYSFGEGKGLIERIADALSTSPEDILSHDLYAVSCTKGFVWGENGELVSSPRLDNLQSVFTSLAGFLNSDECSSIPVMAAFDGEEIGSGGIEGAASDILSTTLKRISRSLGMTDEEQDRMISESLFVSADAAHARHPNHPELFDLKNSPVINGGVVIKYNAQKRYTTTAVSSALFSQIAKMAQVPCQVYANRSDIAGGSTLGHISQERVSALTVEIGAPLLAMHSATETGGARDTEYLARVFEMLYSVSLEKGRDGYIIK